MTEKETVVVSFDIEATGTSPANGSMIMYGMTIVKENIYGHLAHMYKSDKWYIEKKAWYIKEYNGREERCMNEFWAKYPANLEHITKMAQNPEIVAKEMSDYFKQLGEKYNYYFIADPASFDWSWFIDFYDRFGPSDKTYIGYKSICMDGMEKALNFMGIKHNTAKEAEDFGLKMTHFADDDSEFQAYQYLMLIRIMKSKGKLLNSI